MLEINVPLNILEASTPWNLIRGTEQIYNLATRFTGQTGWTLDDPPDGITIANTGVITSDLAHLHTEQIDSLRVVTDQRTIIVPTTIRDWFPSDVDIGLETFHSAFRAHDHSARELWRGIILVSVNRRCGNLDTTANGHCQLCCGRLLGFRRAQGHAERYQWDWIALCEQNNRSDWGESLGCVYR